MIMLPQQEIVTFIYESSNRNFMANAQDLMRTDFIVADINDTVAELIGQMDRSKQGEAVVFDGTAYRGLASKKWLLSSRIDPATMKLKNIVSHRSKGKSQFFVPTLERDTDIAEIARLLSTADVHALPVIAKQNKKDKVVGIVTAMDVVGELRNSYSKVKANELGTMKLVTVQENDELGMAMNLMNTKKVGHIVVTDARGKLVGILSISDVVTDVHSLPRATMRISKAASHQKGKHTGFGTGEKTNPLKLPVHNILTHVPNCCTAAPEDKISAVIDAMVGQNVSTAVLVKSDAPVGILTVKDILNDYAKG
jgi:predicted transcriptional regulator